MFLLNKDEVTLIAVIGRFFCASATLRLHQEVRFAPLPVFLVTDKSSMRQRGAKCTTIPCVKTLQIAFTGAFSY
jgi:hypothetical protein